MQLTLLILKAMQERNLCSQGKLTPHLPKKTNNFFWKKVNTNTVSYEHGLSNVQDRDSRPVEFFINFFGTFNKHAWVLVPFLGIGRGSSASSFHLLLLKSKLSKVFTHFSESSPPKIYTISSTLTMPKQQRG